MNTKLFFARCLLAPLLLLGSPHAARALPAVQVYGEASSSGENVTVQLFADINATPIVSFSAKVFYDPATLRVVQAVRNETVWYFFDGTNQVPYMNPDISQPGEVTFVGGRFDAREPSGGIAGTRVPLGTIVFGRLAPSTPSFLISIGRDGQYASFVTTDGAILEAQPGAVYFGEVPPDPKDLDLDGLADSWEIQFFKSTGVAYFSDDPDGDGYNDYAEQAFGTDPTDPDANLGLRIAAQPGDVMLRWNSATGRVYTIESSESLSSFETLATGIAATPPTNSLALPVTDRGTFYRILLESWPAP